MFGYKKNSLPSSSHMILSQPSDAVDTGWKSLLKRDINHREAAAIGRGIYMMVSFRLMFWRRISEYGCQEKEVVSVIKRHDCFPTRHCHWNSLILANNGNTNYKFY